jgi:hypothetical protein
VWIASLEQFDEQIEATVFDLLVAKPPEDHRHLVEQSLAQL